ncbi:putative lipase [Gordonia hirsuta DSM 44140 = NBRC 16056]|uniref:Putative lipase n=1 Tax=Gordonia hirsuta DSM 44140 = NBRC 16056 TaxID=1121927 RepID=L7LBY6_9ACTN|nr:lipase family protein [Gordonia hirsuta]GAC58261.1 putative lipase [Gordonia hirsuta DSM 44140 = NBRC 16056]
MRRTPLRTVLGLAATVATLAAVAAPVHADPTPPNLAPLPGEVIDGVDRLVPPAAYPRPTTIPQRAQAPGYPRSTLQLREAVLPDPVGDPMFDRWPARLATRANGDVLAVRDITSTAGFLVTVPIAGAHLVKFRSTDVQGQPIFATATIIEPQAPWHGRGPRPILVNNVPINGLGTECTAGYTLAHGFSDKTNQTDLFPPTTQLALSRGYTVIVPDHEGPRQAYAEPTLAGHVVLDSIRAAAKYAPAKYAQSRVAVTGYSGGAIATNGTAKVLGQYAPDLTDRVVGAALGGVPADFRMLAGAMNANLATGVMLAATLGVARERPELLETMNNLGAQLATSDFRNACGSSYGLAGPFQLPAQLLSKDKDPFNSALAEKIYTATELADHRSATPLYIYHGTHEIWIPAQGARNLYAQQCRLGANATYREVPGEHLSAAVIAYPEATQWLADRLEGRPARSGCPRS